MRGKGGRGVLIRILHGITPAHAGKSARRYVSRYSYRDHPRPCGEKIYLGFYEYADEGSPPPMRGKALLPVLTSVLNRITPAHAGKS